MSTVSSPDRGMLHLGGTPGVAGQQASQEPAALSAEREHAWQLTCCCRGFGKVLGNLSTHILAHRLWLT
jgi:hypothetical protein